jgi:GNAT superfamily N-acetyltransferase
MRVIQHSGLSTHDSSAGPVAVRLLGRAAGADASLVGRLVQLVNEVYAEAEDGLWIDGATRTTVPEMRDLVGRGEIAVATMGRDVVGCVRIRELDGARGEFGMLAAAPDRRGVGIGRELVRFAEQRSRERGHRSMQLELLVPREWVHPSKRFLDEWYRRIGYRVTRTGTIDGAYPQLAPLLATPCDFVIYEKPLATVSRS